MRLDPKERQWPTCGVVDVERYDVDEGNGSFNAYGVNVYGVLVGEYTTRREAERHAARIRRALKGER